MPMFSYAASAAPSELWWYLRSRHNLNVMGLDNDNLHSTLVLSVYRQVSNISRTSVDNKMVDHSDVVGASPVGAAPTTSSFST